MAYKGNPEPFGSTDDVEIAEGWVAVPLRDVADSRKGKKPLQVRDRSWPEAVPYVDIEMLETGNPRRYADPKSSVLVKAGDVVVVWDGARCGLARRVPMDGSLGSTLAKIAIPFVNNAYVLRFLESCFEIVNSDPRGTGIPHVDPALFWNLKIPLCPIAEEKRIVATIEGLIDRVNACRSRLVKAGTILKRFRQAVLAAACSGRLTDDWRANHSDIESGADLLLRIKQLRLESAQTKKDRAQVVLAFEDRDLKSTSDNPQFADIPDSWTACQVGTIGSVCSGSTPSRKHPEYWGGGGIPWVSSGEVRNNVISETRERITKDGYDSCSVRLLPRGTVLIAMIGEGKTRGQSAILDIEATTNQNIAAILLGHGFVASKFLCYWFQLQYEATRQEGSGSGPQALNCQGVRELPFVLPPFEEQHEIVRRVEALFNMADAIEKRIAAAAKRAEKLTQAILAKAFRGELVPTEAELARRESREYEPASALLDRIRLGRETKQAAAIA